MTHRRCIGNILLVSLYACIVAQAQQPASIQFRSATGAAPSPSAALGLLVSGAPADAELRVYGIPREPGVPKVLLHETAAQWRTRIRSKPPAPPLLALEGLNTGGIVQLVAYVSDAGGKRLGQAATFTLDQPAALEEAPSPLRRIAQVAGSLLDTLLHSYDIVRSGAAASVYVAPIRAGQPGSPVALDIPAHHIRALALSPKGNRIAWIDAEDQNSQLWVEPLSDATQRKMVAASRVIETPLFAPNGRLFYVQEGTVYCTTESGSSCAFKLPFESVFKIWEIAPAGDAISLKLTGRAAAGPDAPLPYQVTLAPDGSATVRVLADNPFYPGYAAAIEGAPVFYAVSGGAASGIHYIGPKGSGGTFFTCGHPGPIAVSSQATNVAFVCAPAE